MIGAKLLRVKMSVPLPTKKLIYWALSLLTDCRGKGYRCHGVSSPVPIFSFNVFCLAIDAFGFASAVFGFSWFRGSLQLPA